MSSRSTIIRAGAAGLIAAVVSVVPAAHALPPTVPPSAPGIPTGVETEFSNPECVVWDANTGAWYITNNGLSGGEASIAKLVPGGSPQIVASGLDAPQGVAIYNGMFIVADNANVVFINMADPTQRTSVNVGSSNDLDVDPSNGDVYVGSINGGSIKRIRDGVVENFATIAAPDGVEFQDGGVFVNTLGLVDAESGLFRIDVETKAVTTIATVPFAAFDGLEQDGSGWLMTDFAHGQLYRVASDGSLSVLAQLAPGSAQMGFDPVTRTVAVPNLVAGFVVFLTI